MKSTALSEKRFIFNKISNVGVLYSNYLQYSTFKITGEIKNQNQGFQISSTLLELMYGY